MGDSGSTALGSSQGKPTRGCEKSCSIPLRHWKFCLGETLGKGLSRNKREFGGQGRQFLPLYWCKMDGCFCQPALMLTGEERSYHFLVLCCIRIENNHSSETKPAQLNRCKSSGRHRHKPGQAAPMQIMGYPRSCHVHTRGCVLVRCQNDLNSSLGPGCHSMLARRGAWQTAPFKHGQALDKSPHLVPGAPLLGASAHTATQQRCREKMN